MTALRYVIWLPIVIAGSLVVPACYTLLKHPTVDNAVYEEVQASPCTSCHYESEVWYYHHPPAHRLYPEWDSVAWGFYYDVPWWYDSYPRYAAPPDPGTVPLPSRRLRTGTDKTPLGGSVGGPVGPRPDPKATGASVRLKPSDGDSVKDSKDTGRKNADDDATKTRGVRPKTTKEKKGKDKGEKTG